MHRNPVQGKWNLADDFVSYEYSSARYYELEEKGEISIWDYRNVNSESPADDSEGGQSPADDSEGG